MSESFSRPGAVDLSQVSQSCSGSSYVMELSQQGFEQVAAKSMQYPVIVEFYSPRDPQGETLSKALQEAVNAGAGKYLLARVNVDTETAIAQALRVQAVPTVVALLGGQMLPLFQGTKSSDEVRVIVEKVGQAAVASGITGRAAPVVDEGVEGGESSANPRFAAADEALANGNYAQAIAEFDKLLVETPNDVEVIAGRAQAALLQRSESFNSEEIVMKSNENSLQAQLDCADLEVIQGAYQQALDRLLDFAATSDAETKEQVRVRILELFEVIGRSDPIVLHARRRLSTLLF